MLTIIERLARKGSLRMLRVWIQRKVMASFFNAIWPFMSWLSKTIARSRKFVPPGSSQFDSSILLVGNLVPGQRRNIPGIDLTDSIESWLVESMKIKKCVLVDSLDQVITEDSQRVLVVSYDWLISGNRSKHFFKEVRHLAIKARELELVIWVAPTDPFAVWEIIPATILVAMCGGAMILQSNTASEGKVFGLVFPSGPHIWTLPPSKSKQFHSDILWRSRDRKVLLAVSSDPRRKSLMNAIALVLSKSGWNINFSKLNLSWADYTELVKSSQIVITTCWMYQVHLRGLRKTRVPKTTLTHRVLEGFAAGSLVITNSNSALDSLGFKAGVHFVELWTDIELKEGIQLPDDVDLERIASAGYDLFSEIVRGELST